MSSSGTAAYREIYTVSCSIWYLGKTRLLQSHCFSPPPNPIAAVRYSTFPSSFYKFFVSSLETPADLAFQLPIWHVTHRFSPSTVNSPLYPVIQHLTHRFGPCCLSSSIYLASTACLAVQYSQALPPLASSQYLAGHCLTPVSTPIWHKSVCRHTVSPLSCLPSMGTQMWQPD